MQSKQIPVSSMLRTYACSWRIRCRSVGECIISWRGRISGTAVPGFNGFGEVCTPINLAPFKTTLLLASKRRGGGLAKFSGKSFWVVGNMLGIKSEIRNQQHLVASFEEGLTRPPINQEELGGEEKLKERRDDGGAEGSQGYKWGGGRAETKVKRG